LYHLDQLLDPLSGFGFAGSQGLDLSDVSLTSFFAPAFHFGIFELPGAFEQLVEGAPLCVLRAFLRQKSAQPLAQCKTNAGVAFSQAYQKVVAFRAR